MKKGKRDLMKKLQHLVFELVDINKDIATLDVRDNITAARRAKKAMLAHQRNSEEFKKEIDRIRKHILRTKAGLDDESEDIQEDIQQEEQNKEQQSESIVEHEKDEFSATDEDFI